MSENTNSLSVEDKKGNILILGNSGVGKSPLINSILGTADADTGIGGSGTTNKLTVYDCSDYGCSELNMRFIDTPGFEPSIISKNKIIHSIRKWSAGVAKSNKNSEINEIWFCVDGMASKLFNDTLKNLSSAVSFWKSVPIIVVITKSFSAPDREKKVEMVENAFKEEKKLNKNLKAVIPVVAATLTTGESAYVEPYGIPELIEKAGELLPEGMKAAVHDINAYKLKRRRILSQTVAGAATSAAVVVGAVPVPFSDAALLVPVEIGEVNGIAKVYGIKNNDQSKEFIDSIVKVGTVSIAAKAAISALKAIPGVDIAAGVINAIIAGAIAAAIGEGSIYAFEQIYLGRKSLNDVEWVTKLIESKIDDKFIDKVSTILKNASDGADKNTILSMIKAAFEKDNDK